VSFELWLLLAFVLTIAEIVAPGTFLFFFGMGALAAGLVAVANADLRLQVLVFVVVSGLAVLFGRALYRRILARRDDASGIGRGPLGEHGVVVDPIVDGRGKVRVRDTVWLAAGPDLRPGAAVIVQRRDGTLLHVAPVGSGRGPPAKAD
jgi:membrane protein implicated in regulation of membrane protease activity